MSLRAAPSASTNNYASQLPAVFWQTLPGRSQCSRRHLQAPATSPRMRCFPAYHCLGTRGCLLDRPYARNAGVSLWEPVCCSGRDRVCSGYPFWLNVTPCSGMAVKEEPGYALLRFSSPQGTCTACLVLADELVVHPSFVREIQGRAVLYRGIHGKFEAGTHPPTRHAALK